MIGQELSRLVNQKGQKFIEDAQKETNKYKAIDSSVYESIAHEIGGLRNDMNSSKIKATNQIRKAKKEFLETTEAMDPQQLNEGAKNLEDVEAQSQALDAEGKKIVQEFNDDKTDRITRLKASIGVDTDFLAGLNANVREDLIEDEAKFVGVKFAKELPDAGQGGAFDALPPDAEEAQMG